MLLLLESDAAGLWEASAVKGGGGGGGKSVRPVEADGVTTPSSAVSIISFENACDPGAGGKVLRLTGGDDGGENSSLLSACAGTVNTWCSEYGVS
jgi:hypothetical protein